MAGVDGVAAESAEVVLNAVVLVAEQAGRHAVDLAAGPVALLVAVQAAVEPVASEVPAASVGRAEVASVEVLVVPVVPLHVVDLAVAYPPGMSPVDPHREMLRWGHLVTTERVPKPVAPGARPVVSA